MRNDHVGQITASVREQLDKRLSTVRKHANALQGRIDAAERQRLVSLAFAFAAVGTAVLLQTFVSSPSATSSLWLLHAAVAIAASYGGFSAASLAILTSLLVARVNSGVDF